MPDRLEIDPDVLRALANQHYQVARDTREWAQPPTEWLDSFEPTYGKIADPVKQALKRYYNARQRAGEALAREHERTADSLIASADAYEKHDIESAADIRSKGDEVGDTFGPAPVAPVGEPVGPTPGIADTPVTAPAGPTGAPVLNGAGPIGDTPGATPGPGTSAPTGAGTPTAPTGPIGVPTQEAAGTDGSALPSTGSTPAADGLAGTPPVGATAGGPLGAPVGVGPVGGDYRGGTTPPSGAVTNADGTPAPVPLTPFGAAVAAAKEKATAPDYVVGEEVNEDLVIARTLLSAVLAAVETTVGMTWSVSVMRGPAGAGVFITSNEGRGWLPAGLYLPREVSTPWVWDEMLRTEDDSSGSPWEGVSDPARVLVEFGLAWGAKANAQLSALVSSGPIDPGLRARFSDVPMEGVVGPSDDVDLRVFTPDTVDRLGLTGSPRALESVAATPDNRVRTYCVELALDAQAQLVRSVAAPPESGGVRAIRDRILAQLEFGAEIPQQWWDELRDADDLIAATMISHRVDVGRVGLGELRVDNEAAVLRVLAWERRCNELVMLLAQETNRQSLRDAVYAHEQVVGHPSFVAVPVAVSTGEGVSVERPAATGGVSVSPPSGVVSAPTVTAGPPAGAVVPPVSAPPTVSPERESS